MTYKDILVYLDPTSASAARLDIALRIAKEEGAFLTGVDASTEDAFLGDWREAAVAIEDGFHAALKAQGVAGEFHVPVSRGKRLPEDFVIPPDLVIAPSPSPEVRRLIHPALPDEMVKQAGRRC